MATTTVNLGLIKPDPPDSMTAYPTQYTSNLNVLDNQLLASDFTAYTPVLTGTVTNPTLGASGFVDGDFLLLGPHLTYVWIRMYAGTSGFGAGSGIWRFSLPFNAASLHTASTSNIDGDCIGRAYLRDNSSATTSCTAAAQLCFNGIGGGVPRIQLITERAANKDQVGDDAPFLWTNEDRISIFLRYLRA